MEDKIMLSYDERHIQQLKDMTTIGMTCMVYGNVGKTTLIRLLYSDLLVLDARQFRDPKNLCGFYKIEDGKICYMRGILGEAMEKGRMVCFKNIENNQELLDYIRPIFGGGSLIGNEGEEIFRHQNFRIFLTSARIIEVRNVVMVGPIGFEKNSVMKIFGSMRKYLEQIFNWIELNAIEKCQVFQDGFCKKTCLQEIICDCKASSKIDDNNYTDENKNSFKDIICSKHFLMLCELNNFLRKLKEVGGIDESNHNRYILYEGIVGTWLKHESDALAEYLYVTKPTLVLPDMSLVKTEALESVLRGLLLNIKAGRPTLLVGETGGGKTAILEYLRRNATYFFGSSREMCIVNMSSDFDGDSFIGSYQSYDLDKEIALLIENNCKINDIGNSNDIKMSMVWNRNKHGRIEILRQIIQQSVNNKNIERAKMLLKVAEGGMAFYFKEGLLTHAMREGLWLMIDEINLAPDETLQLLEAIVGQKELFVDGLKTVSVHEKFILFGCMNPAGDHGKKDYQSRVFAQLPLFDFSTSLMCIQAVVAARTRNSLTFGSKFADFYYVFRQNVVNRKFTNVIEPLVSGRTLCRALDLIVTLISQNHFAPVYAAIRLLFLTQLDLSSRVHAINLAREKLGNDFITGNLLFEEVNNGNGNNINLNNNFECYTLTEKMRFIIEDVELAIQCELPILLQGDTSTGKTSLIYALANKYNRHVIRINNHQHTDANDYIGHYVTTPDGLLFRAGPLVTALRNGFWVILDELNLASSEVLEVLNRLLDDNRELFIPDLNEIIRPHSNFRIFATQNIGYAGRNGLAKSLRNRFVEICFYEKDEKELIQVLTETCKLPKSFVSRMTAVYTRLHSLRSIDILMTLRDLFKWAKRGPTDHYEVFEIGMDILRTRVRSDEDIIKIETIFLEVFNSEFLIKYKDNLNKGIDSNESNIIKDKINISNIDISKIFNNDIFNITNTVLINNNLKSSTLVMTRSYKRLINLIKKAWMCKEPVLLIGETGIGKTRICEEVSALFGCSLRTINMHNGTESSDFIGTFILDGGIVRWNNGILIDTMIKGDCLLIDEINLADDRVLERMNSMLEDRRSIYVTEQECEYKAHDKFRVVATMNPSGDYGKREISPALRNRFTEIFFRLERDEYNEIFDCLLDNKLNKDKIINYNDNDFKKYISPNDYFKKAFKKLTNVLTIRKIELIIFHITNLIFKINNCSKFLEINYPRNYMDIWKDALALVGLCDNINNNIITDITPTNINTNNNISSLIGVNPYFIKIIHPVNFCFNSPTMRCNLQRILRGLSIGRGILLIGEPGVGKTSIISTISKICGVSLLRINLSEQTEISDLVGSYLPIGNDIRFIESEMIRHIRDGGWILLDEINLCTQSVIEGLNSMLDYRRTIEVNGKTVLVHEDTRIFGTMNPANAINGRKELPKSFKDRFIEILMDNYLPEDYIEILKNLFGENFFIDKTLTLRGNIKLNKLSSNINSINDNSLDFKNKVSNFNFKTRFNINFTKRNSFSKIIHYFIDKDRFIIGDVSVKYFQLDESFVLVHSQLLQIETILKCIAHKLPIIITGYNGKTPLLRFISKLLNLNLIIIECHKTMDTSDLLGHYIKTDTGDALFSWADSRLISSLTTSSLIVFNTPETVDNCVFDRLFPLFESDRCISIFEKGPDSTIVVNENCVFCLCCDNISMLSPALYDRCVHIELSDIFSYIDLFKMNYNSNYNSNSFNNNFNNDNFNNDNFNNDNFNNDNFNNDNFNNDNFKVKRFQKIKDNNILLQFSKIDFSIIYNFNIPNWLDILIRQRRTNITYLNDPCNINLGIYNALHESVIDSFFIIQKKLLINYNKSLIENYRKVAKYASIRPTNLRDFVDRLKINIESFSSFSLFIKAFNYNIKNEIENQDIKINENNLKIDKEDIIKNNNIFKIINESSSFINCYNAPADMCEFKMQFIKGLNKYKIRDLHEIIYFIDNISNIRLSFINKTLKDFNYNGILSKEDPLLLVKIELQNEYINKENKLIEFITEIIKAYYKYGKIDYIEKYITYIKSLNSECVEYIKSFNFDRLFNNSSLINNFLKILIFARNSISTEYNLLISNIDKKLKRDYTKYLKIIQNITFCKYASDHLLRNFLEDFSDVFDAYLIQLFNQRLNCLKCYSTSGIESIYLYEMFRSTGYFTKLLNNEYCKFIYSNLKNIKSNLGDYFLEAIILNERINLNDYTFYKINNIIKNKSNIINSYFIADNIIESISNTKLPNIELFKIDEFYVDLALRSLIPDKTSPHIIEARFGKITLGRDFISCELTDNCLIYSTVEFLLDHIIISQEKLLNSLYQPQLPNKIEITKKFLLQSYKTRKCLSFELNYRYFFYFLDYNGLSSESIDYFLFNSSVYEYLDKIYFTQQFIDLIYLSNQYYLLLYNSILRCKAFEIEELNIKKINETSICLIRQPELFESTIRKYVDKFLLIPVITILRLTFIKPIFNKNNENYSFNNISDKNLESNINIFLNKFIPYRLINGFNGSEYEAWIKLSENISKEKIAEILDLDNRKINQLKFFNEIKNSFFKRPPLGKFCYNEICLAKAYNNIINNNNKGFYTIRDSFILAILLEYGYTYLFPPFFYFLFKLSEQLDLKVENGLSLRSGEGLEYIKDDIKEEDIIDDYDDNKNCEQDDDAIDMDNEGDLESISKDNEDLKDQEDSLEQCVDCETIKNGEQEEQNDKNKDEKGEAEDEIEGQNENEYNNIDEDIEDIEDIDKDNEDNEDNEDNDKDNEIEIESEIDNENESNENESNEISDCNKSNISDNSDKLNNSNEIDESNNLDTNINKYEYEDLNIFNRNQGCDLAEGYNKKIEGGSLELKDVPKEGGINDYEKHEFVIGGDGDGIGQIVFENFNFENIKTDSFKLVNLLRVILKGNENNKYRGDYKTGKKLNLKKIVPYIASDFRKDKIWLRRLNKDKPQYKIRLFIDNSKSMYDKHLINNFGLIFYQLHDAFSILNIPVELYKFGNHLIKCKIDDLTFTDTTTTIEWVDTFTDGINIILTDGIFQTVHFYNSNFIVIMIDKGGNIQKMSKVSLIDGKVFLEKYLSNFTLKYCIVETLDDLEKVFVKALSDIILENYM